MDPIKIQAQFLRRHATSTQDRGIGAFGFVADDAANHQCEGKDRPSGNWREADVERAISAAEKAGLRSYRVEIAPDGAIAIIVGDPADTAPISDEG